MLKNIANHLMSLDEKNKSAYETNLEKAFLNFDEAKTRIVEILSSSKGKTIVTSHEAFGYFCSEFGLTQVGISDIADHEPSAKRLQEIVSFMKKEDIHVIYAESLDELGYCETVQEELSKEGFAVTFATLDAHEGGSESSFKEGKHLLSILEENAKTIAKHS